MSDLIDRQAAIDVLRNRWMKTINYEGVGEDIAESKVNFAYMLQNMAIVVLLRVER